MQLTTPKNISLALAAASCALIGAPASATDNAGQWQIETALMYYGETSRVSALEGVVQARKDFGDEHVFTGKMVFDALTGASATGAVPQPSVQTFTRPSGRGQYTIAEGETPLDDTFHDTRVQLNGQWSQPITRDYTLSSGINVSKEYDYMSIAANGALTRDFNKHNSTVTAGLSYAYDTISPEGGRPVGLSAMVLEDEFDSSDAYWNAFDQTRQQGSETKSTLDLLLSFTQVINRRTVMLFNYSYSQASGYLTDPFKLISVVNSDGITQENLYEVRPDKRLRHSLFWQTKHALDSGVADVSYRYSNDDWGVDSHTIESRFRYNLTDHSYLQPHVRYYLQSAADFYQPFLLEGETLPQYASADYRIGDMTTYTLGFKYGQELSNGHEWAFRLEYYQQSPENSGFDAPGVLQGLDLYPAIKAVIAQVSYSF